MKADVRSGQGEKATETGGQIAPQVEKAAATVPHAELRETLAEAYETVQMLEKAVITAKQAEEEEKSRYKPFIAACSKGDEPTARALLATGLNVNWRNKQGVAALHVAAFNGHTAVVRMLLEQGAEVDPRAGEIESKLGLSFVGATPWFLAKANRKGAAAELLAFNGADPNATVGPGLTWQAVHEVIAKAGGAAFVPA